MSINRDYPGDDPTKDLREMLADYAFYAKRYWVRQLLRFCEKQSYAREEDCGNPRFFHQHGDMVHIIPKWMETEWERPLKLAYDDLTEDQKEVYRNEADLIFDVLREK